MNSDIPTILRAESLKDPGWLNRRLSLDHAIRSPASVRRANSMVDMLSQRNLRHRHSIINLSRNDIEKISLHMKRLNVAETIRETEAGHGAIENFRNFDDYLFDILKEDNTVYLSRFILGLQNVGIQESDPRISDCMKNLQQAQEDLASSGEDIGLDRDIFKTCLSSNTLLLKRAFNADFVIPNFLAFRKRTETIFTLCKANKTGEVAANIPEFSRFDSNSWGVSICTIDGQRHDMGSTDMPFTLSDSHHPLSYALCINDLSSDFVGKYVGEEPSGETSQCIKLDKQDRPHNPMITAGAIVTASLLDAGQSIADRFDYVSQQFKRLAGNEFVGFNNVIYLSERESAKRYFALGYYMDENKCFPPGTKLEEILDFYIQLRSVEVTSESASVIAATLANGGVCPLTGDRVLRGEAVRNTLSLMHSCGMYDYSGQFAFQVGLPAKSGVSGTIILVIPNVMGICIWSPLLDDFGNSARGIQFCKELVETFNFHQYDSVSKVQKYDPRQGKVGVDAASLVYTLLRSSFDGDLEVLKRLYLSGADMGAVDYDGRTALHVCAAEGHVDCAKFLLKLCGVQHSPVDRWGRTPLSEASDLKQDEVHAYLQDFINTQSVDQSTRTEQQ